MDIKVNYKKNKFIFCCFLGLFASNNVLAAKNDFPVKLQEQREEQLKQLSTDKIIEQIDPFSEEQKKEIKRVMREKEKSQSIPDIEFQLINRSIPVKVTPGQVPPVIHVSRNFATTLTFVDKAGNPWPIYKYMLPPELFTVNVIKDNMLQIVPKKRYVKTNAQIMLLKSKYQISFILDSATHEERVDDKPVIMLDAFSPESFNGNNTNPLDYVTNMNSRVKFEQSDYLSLVEGRTPDGAEQKRVVSLDGYSLGNEVEAWEKGGNIYIRMKYGEVLNPDPGLNKMDAYGNKIFSVSSDYKDSIMINFNGYLTTIKVI